MGNIGLNEQQVFEAAEKLHEKNIIPTLQTIRQELGTGSYATISKYLAQWKAAKAPKQDIPEVSSEFANYIKKFWAICYKEAAANLEAEREALRSERLKLSEDKADLYNVIQKLEEEQSLAYTEKVRLEQKLEKANQQISHLNEELVKVKTQLESSEQRRKEDSNRADRFEEKLTAIINKKFVSSKDNKENSSREARRR